MKYNINFEERCVYIGNGQDEPVRMTFDEIFHLQAEIDAEDISRSKYDFPDFFNLKELDKLLNIRKV